MYADSHAHLDAYDAESVDRVLDRASAAGVSMIVAVGGTAEGNVCAIRCAERRPNTIVAAAGYDRDQAESNPDMSILTDQLATPQVRALGEIGLDYHYLPGTRAAQTALFEDQLALAAERKLPVIVHTREADDDTYRLLKEHAGRWAGRPEDLGVVHCFTGSGPFARRLLDLGYHIGFSGILTFKNAAALREVAAGIPDDRLLIETDTPYLAPVPHRGHKNEPAWVVEVARILAEIRNCSAEDVAAITADNTRRLFGSPCTRA